MRGEGGGGGEGEGRGRGGGGGGGGGGGEGSNDRVSLREGRSGEGISVGDTRCTPTNRTRALVSYLLLSMATFSTCEGSGRKSMTASSSGWTPLFLRAEPIRTGVKLRLMVARRIAA